MSKVKKYLATAWKFVTFSPSIAIGLTILIAILVIGFGVSFFAPANTLLFNGAASNLPPSIHHLLGTTVLGQDVFWILTIAIRNSLILGMIASALGLLIGTSLGLIAGYKGGLTEKLILLFADTFIVIPGLPILILLSLLLKEQLSPVLLGVVIASITWGLPVRDVRSMILSLREREFTNTALFSGYKTGDIVTSEYVPHLFPWLVNNFINRINVAIGLEIALAVFGLTSLQQATIGTMVYWVTSYQALLRGLWWWFLAPVLAVVLIVVSLYVFSTGLLEYLNYHGGRLSEHN